MARHPALHSIGLTVLLGIAAAVPSALLVIPAFSQRVLKNNAQTKTRNRFIYSG
jgi:hypothetical protein